jgi:hypothetical protein
LKNKKTAKQMDEQIILTVRQVVTELLSDNKCIKYNDVREHNKIKELRIGDISLRSIIYDFVRNGFIIEKQKASGRRPALYSFSDSHQSTVNIESRSDDLIISTKDVIPEDIESNEKPGILKQFTLKISETKRKIREIEIQDQEINKKIEDLKRETNKKIEDLERERKILREKKQILENSQSNLQELQESYITELKRNELEDSQALAKREVKGGQESDSDNYR